MARLAGGGWLLPGYGLMSTLSIPNAALVASMLFLMYGRSLSIVLGLTWKLCTADG